MVVPVESGGSRAGPPPPPPPPPGQPPPPTPPAGTTVLVVGRGVPALIFACSAPRLSLHILFFFFFFFFFFPPLFFSLVFFHNFWAHAFPLAAALAPHADVPVEHGTPDIARVLVALVGIMTVLQTLPRLVNLVLNIFAAAGDPDAMPGGALRRALIGTGIEFACALFLVMRPERFLDFLNRSRSEPAEATA